MSNATKNFEADKPVTTFEQLRFTFEQKPNVMAQNVMDDVMSGIEYEPNAVQAVQVQWEEETTEETYSKALAFGELDTKIVYKVTPVKVIVRKYGPQLLMEVEDMDDIKHESFPVFAPNNYRERVKKLCDSSMVPHMLKYNGMELKNSRKVHSYRVGLLQAEPDN